jgi:serine phosphatase RsbU (regulator of sigma subunit)
MKAKPGDVIAFCSDGLQDCVDARGEALGTERLLAFLAQRANDTAQQIADGLIQVAHERAGTESQDDDRTVVVLKVN